MMRDEGRFMRKIKIGICEDDVTQLRFLQQQTEHFFAEKGFAVAVEMFESAEQLLFHYPSSMPFQCLLLDIGLKKMDGMDLAKRIRTIDKELSIIFITGEKEYVLEGYKVGAIRFLLKPYKPEDLAEALSSALQVQEEKSVEEYISFYLQGEYMKLKRNEIVLAEVCGHYLTIKSTKQDYNLKGSMKMLREEWKESCFVLANRSVLVNLENVEKITRTECFMSDGSIIPVSRGCYQNLNKSFVEWYM